MKKTNYYRYLFYCILVFGLISCEKENVETENTIQKSELDLSNYKFSMTSYEHIKDIDKSSIKAINKLLRSKNDVQNSRLSSSNYDFYIDEDQVQILEAEYFNIYTFVAKRDYETPNLLENYLYIHYNDDSYKQFLVSCNYTLEENGQYNFDESTQIATEIFENSLLNRQLGCVMELIDSYEGTICTAVQCTGAGHDPGEDCECDTSTSCNEAYVSCETGTIYVYEENCSGGGSSSTGDNGNTGPDSTTTGGSEAGNGGNGFVWKPVKSTPINEQLKGIISMYNLTPERVAWIDDPANSLDKVWALVNLANENRDDDGFVSQEVNDLILFLIDIMIEIPNYSFNEALLSYINDNLESELELNNNSTTVSFLEVDTITEINEFINNFNNSFNFSIEESETVDIFSQDLKLTRFKGEFPATLFPVNLNIDVKSELDDPDTYTIDEFNLDSVTSFDSGVTTFIDWVQDTYVITSEGETFVEVTVYGHFDLGIKFLGENLTFTEDWIIQVVFNKKTGQPIDMNASLN